MRNANLDEIDHKIIEELREDGRRPVVEVAKATAISEATVRRRLAKLLEDDIGRIVLTLNPLKFGYQVEIVLNLSVELGKAEAVAEELVQYEEINYVGLVTGDYDILVHAHFRSNEDVLNFLTHKVAKIEGVRDTQTSFIFKVVKRTSRWSPLDRDAAREMPPL